MLGLNTCIDADIADTLAQLLITHLGELCSGQRLRGITENAELARNGDGGVAMIAGYHNGNDARLSALLDSRADLGTNGIYHTDQTEEYKLLLERLGSAAIRQLGERSVCCGKHAQRLLRHRAVLGFDPLAQLGGHGDKTSVDKCRSAASEQNIRRALGVLNGNISAVGPADGCIACGSSGQFLAACGQTVYGGHHLSHRIKGCLGDSRLKPLKLRFMQLERRGIGYKRRLGRLADNAVSALACVRAKCKRGREQPLIAAVVTNDGHAVLRQSSGLIGAYDLRAAERLDGGKPAYNGIALRHISNADGEHYGNDRRESLGYRRNGKADRNHKHVDNSAEYLRRIAGQLIASADERVGEYKHAYAENDHRQQL